LSRSRDFRQDGFTGIRPAGDSHWSDLKVEARRRRGDTAFAVVLRRILLAHGLDMTKGDYELVALGATGARARSMIKGETLRCILTPQFGH